MSSDTTYKITVATAHRFATGTISGTGSRTVEVREAATILGGCRAIDAALALVPSALTDYSPGISPNPAELGWPLGA